jgi:selenocysteine-specific elongation factor
MDGVILTASQFSALKESVVATLAAYHKTYPLKRGMPREELRSKFKLQPRAFNLVIARLIEQSTLASPSQSSISLPGHVVRFSAFQQVKVDKVMAMFAAAPSAPPSVKECLAETGEDIFAVLVDSGDLVQVSAEVVFRKQDYDAMVEKVRQALQQKGQVTLAEVRDLLQTSRKYVQALLEHLDAEGVTVRVGEARKLK